MGEDGLTAVVAAATVSRRGSGVPLPDNRVGSTNGGCDGDDRCLVSASGGRFCVAGSGRAANGGVLIVSGSCCEYGRSVGEVIIPAFLPSASACACCALSILAAAADFEPTVSARLMERRAQGGIEGGGERGEHRAMIE